MSKLEQILSDFTHKTKGVEYTGLYSSDCLPLYEAGQWDDAASVADLQVKILELGDVARQGWGESKQIWIIGKTEGYLIVVFCDNEYFLLVKADSTSVLGQLKAKIDNTLKQVEAELKAEAIPSTPIVEVGNGDSTSTPQPTPANNSEPIKYRYRGATN